MKTLIIEDERPAAKRLAKLLAEHCPSCEILATLDSVKAAVKWLQNAPSPDLIFMDIQLADGLSFDIFSKTEVSAPVIFTTAFDQYTLRAFKVNSVDYLLKPIDPEELKVAIGKYHKFFRQPGTYDRTGIEKMLETVLNQQKYKERFLVKTGQSLSYVPVNDIAYFYSEDGIAFAQCANGKKHIIEYTLDQLETLLDPSDCFRINRQVILRIEAIQKISTWFNSRLKLELSPNNDLNFVVSRERVQDFKKWLDK
ncbi:MAG TPA: response regulator transcription factor [Bacteroidetes bacterium]|nr:response regulator transcription factor [Bacteroidota bacterium]